MLKECLRIEVKFVHGASRIQSICPGNLLQLGL